MIRICGKSTLSDHEVLYLPYCCVYGSIIIYLQFIVCIGYWPGCVYIYPNTLYIYIYFYWLVMVGILPTNNKRRNNQA